MVGKGGSTVEEWRKKRGQGGGVMKVGMGG